MERVAISFSRGSSPPRDQALLCLLHVLTGCLPLVPPGEPRVCMRGDNGLVGMAVGVHKMFLESCDFALTQQEAEQKPF